jgi:hypothetical protein
MSKEKQKETRAEFLRRQLSGQRGRQAFKNLNKDMTAKLADGKTYLRVLPWNPKDTSMPPMLGVARHFNIGGTMVPCLDSILGGGDRCPVCKGINKNRKNMSKEEFQSWSSEIRANGKFAVWGLDLTAPNKPPKIYELPKGVGEKIGKKFDDTDEGGPWWLPETKYDFRISKEGSGMLTEYEVEKSTKFAKFVTPKSLKLADLEAVYELSDSLDEWETYIEGLLVGQDGFGGMEEASVSGTVSDEEASVAVAKKPRKKAEPESDDASEEVSADSDAKEEASEEASVEESTSAEASEEASEEAPKAKATKKKAAPAQEEVSEDSAESEDSESVSVEAGSDDAPKAKATKKKAAPAPEEDSAESASEELSEETSEGESAEVDSESASVEAPKAKATKKKAAPAPEEDSEEESVEAPKAKAGKKAAAPSSDDKKRADMVAKMKAKLSAAKGKK